MRNFFYFFLLIFLLYSCATSRYIKPLHKGEQQVSASLGGPLIGYSGVVIPVPNTSLNYGRGVTDNFTAFGSLYTTSLAYGVFQIDLGGTYRFMGNDSARYGLSASAAVNMGLDKWEWKFAAWPMLELNGYYNIGQKGSYVFAGMGSWIEWSRYKAHQIRQTEHFLLFPQAGFHWQKTKWSFEAEWRWFAPGRMNLPNAVDYRGISHQGAMGLFFSFNRRF